MKRVDVVEKEFSKNQETSDKSKYADFYGRHFNGLRPQLIMEIGVLEGGSLRAWSKIFPDARVVGIDIEKDLKKRYPDLEIRIGDQKDSAFLDEVLGEIGIPDIIIDDGGHCRSQQVTSFNHLFPRLNSGGLYIIEDIETSYLADFNDQELSAIELIKALIVPLNYTCPEEEPPGRIFHYAAQSITFEPNVCLIKK